VRATIRCRVRRRWRRPGARRVELVEVGSITLRVAIEGEGPPLLLVSGLGGNLDMWAPFQRHLEGFEVIAFDPPGTGGSGPGRLAMSMPGMARLAAHLMSALDRDRLDVLGYSWGGALAQELAHRFPERVRRLVLCATTCGLGGVPGSARALAALANPWRASCRPDLPPDRRPTFVGYAAQLCAITRWTSLPWLHRLHQPTLVVAGDDDPVVPLANARLLANLIPDSRLHLVPGGGHLLLLDRTEEVAPVVTTFLLTPDGHDSMLGQGLRRLAGRRLGSSGVGRQ
jgi:pimeloyl-ACP methyl ester carboxylesterase